MAILKAFEFIFGVLLATELHFFYRVMNVSYGKPRINDKKQPTATLDLGSIGKVTLW